MPAIEIVSHPLCPYAQRLVLITLSKGWRRNADFAVTYLDLRTLSETVTAHSPTGGIPALKIDGSCRTTTTEHAAEYLDAIGGPALLPSDAAARLIVRERESKIRATLDALRLIFSAQSDASLDAALTTFFAHLADIDHDLTRDETDERTIRMDMAALAPVFSLATFHKGLAQHRLWEGIPRLRDIAQRLAANPLVISSRCPDYEAEFSTFFAVTRSIFPARYPK